MEFAIPNKNLMSMITMISHEILRFINRIVADRTKDSAETHNMYSSMEDVDLKKLSVTFGLHNAMTDTIVYKSYDLEVFASICSDQTNIETEFNELTDYMIKKSNEAAGKVIVLNGN